MIESGDTKFSAFEKLENCDSCEFVETGIADSHLLDYKHSKNETFNASSSCSHASVGRFVFGLSRNSDESGGTRGGEITRIEEHIYLGLQQSDTQIPTFGLLKNGDSCKRRLKAWTSH